MAVRAVRQQQGLEIVPLQADGDTVRPQPPSEYETALLIISDIKVL